MPAGFILPDKAVIAAWHTVYNFGLYFLSIITYSGLVRGCNTKRAGRIMLMYKGTALCILVTVLSFFIISGCNTGGGSGNIIINGSISNSGQFGTFTVTVSEDNSRLDRTNTDGNGDFTLRFRSFTGNVTIRFESSTFDAERPGIRVTEDSTVVMNFTLQQSPTLIIINSWQVFQDPFVIRNDSQFTLVETLIDFIMDGNGGNCIISTGTSSATIRVKSIDITGCREGVRTQDSGSVVLEADEGITLRGNRDAVVTLNESFVSIGESSNPVNNSVLIESANQFGINAAGNSTVIIDPQNNNCTVSGGRMAVNISGSATVDTAGCTLSDG
jgi:predicted small secreted protein